MQWQTCSLVEGLKIEFVRLRSQLKNIVGSRWGQVSQCRTAAETEQMMDSDIVKVLRLENKDLRTDHEGYSRTTTFSGRLHQGTTLSDLWQRARYGKGRKWWQKFVCAAISATHRWRLGAKRRNMKCSWNYTISLMACQWRELDGYISSFTWNYNAYKRRNPVQVTICNHCIGSELGMLCNRWQ